MFGQQPQQQYGYPQQGYGYQPQQRQPAQLSSLGDLLAGNSAKAYFGANSQPGARDRRHRENRDHTGQRLPDQAARLLERRASEGADHVIIQTQLRDPSVDDDDGRRSLWIKGWGIQLKAFRDACRQAGVKIPKPGDTITERFVGLGQRGDAPQPPKVFEFHIEPASSAQQSRQRKPTPAACPAGLPAASRAAVPARLRAAAVRATAASADPESGISDSSGGPVEPPRATAAAATRSAGAARPAAAAAG